MKNLLSLYFILLSFVSQAQNDINEIKVLKSKILQFENAGEIYSEEYANSLMDLGIIFFEMRDLTKAEPLFLIILENYKEVLGKKHTFYATATHYLAVLYLGQGKYSKAEPLFVKILEYEKESEGEKHLGYIANLVSLALVYQNLGKFNEAEQSLLKALANLKEISGENDPKYASYLSNLAGLYKDLTNYSKAEDLYLKTLKIRKEIFGENHPSYATSLNNLALLYIHQGKFIEAEPLILKAISIAKETSGEKDHNYSIYLDNLATVYKIQGKYSEAQSLFKKVLEIKKEILGENHPSYATSMNNLAILYIDQGKYIAAEPLLLKSLEIRKENLGEKNEDYANSLSSLGLLYKIQGKYSEAERLYLKSILIRKEIFGENHPSYASALNNLGVLYYDERKYSEAEPLYLKSLEIRKETLGEKHSSYIFSLNSLGNLYSIQGKYSEAERFLTNALLIQKGIVGELHPDYAIILNNIALAYFHNGKYSEAEAYFIKSLEIQKKILGENHPNYINSLYYLAVFYQTIKLQSNSSIYYEKFIKVNHKRIINDIDTLTEKELIAYINVRKEELFSPLSFLNGSPNQYPEINVGSYENELLFKSLTLRNKEHIKKSIQKAGDNSLRLKYDQFIENKIKITKLQDLPLDKRPIILQTLEAETEQLEKELTKESSAFADFRKSLSIKFNKVKDKLKNDEIAVEIVALNYFQKIINDIIIYAAFIVKKDSKFPKFISLFEEKQLNFLLNTNTNQPDSTRIDKQYTNKTVSDLFLKPLEKELEGISTIYLSLSGLGHQIDFAALPLSENQTFGEKYKLHILSSPAELIDYKVSKIENKNNTELLLYGGINYNNYSSKNEITTEIVEKNNDISSLKTRSSKTIFGYLPRTNIEISQIQSIGTEYGFATTILNEDKATEESIKALDGRTNPFVLHLATHGFFFPDPEQEIPKDVLLETGKAKIYKTSDNPMMRSGLLFAGANNFWSKTNLTSTTDDGILTANEISNLDLSACQLVVLSACETALGEVKGSEGVFGLQRAFKMAGVKNIIMSLWKVPDTQTAELFEIFYSECFVGKTIHEAFQTAQSKMKAKYSPYYWAGFVLLE